MANKKVGCKKGSIPWNKGLTTETDERVRRNGDARKGYKQTEEWIKNRFKGREGYKHSEETKRKIGKSNSGIIRSEEFRKMLREKPVVHHINGDHFDDRPENRQEMTRSEHVSLHWDQGDILNGRTITA